MSARAVLRHAASTLLLATFGCDSDFALSDSVDDVIDFAAVAGDRSLHAPYVVGAHFDLHAPAGVASLASSDDDVLQIEGNGAVVQATAIDAGMVDVLALDDSGDVIGATTVEVRMPTRAVLHAAAPVFLDRSDVSTEVTRPRLAAGGTATYLVQYFDGPTRLWGSGGLEVAGSVGVTVRVDHELLGEHRDWLTVVGGEPGVERVALGIGGETFSEVDIDVVDPSSIADLDVFASDDVGDPNASGVVVATAYDLDGERIDGVPFEWSLAPGAELVAADIVRYRADALPMELFASFGELGGGATVHADEADAAQGCNVGGARPGAWGAWALVLLVVGATRRRS